MKKGTTIAAVVAICLVAWGAGLALVAEAEEAPSLAFGARMQLDGGFYVQGGVIGDAWDAIASIGWNNAYWIGGHAYVMPGESGAGFIGLELHLENVEGVLKFGPALAIGYAARMPELALIVESLLMPVPSGEEPRTLFAVSFLYTFGDRDE
jgi:hypothetical protein